MMRRLFIITGLFFVQAVGFTQTLDSWANNVHWDGVTSWKRYLIFSAGYMGPNALPVPEISNGSIDSVTTIGITGNFHFSNGDNAQNIKLTGNYCIVKNVISVDISYIPSEWFQQNHAVKEARHVYYTAYYKKQEPGDAYLNINLQLLNKLRNHIQLALRLGYRFPTGSITGAARYTDSPGYFFDLSCAKPLSPDGHWKLLGMVGFYVWQTNLDEHFQDDAYLFGAGVEYNKNNWRWQLNSCTYLGYMRNGDKPVVLRLGAEKSIKNITGVLRFQQGLHDFKYSSVEAGAKFHLGK
jgi:hypothetical protein